MFVRRSSSALVVRGAAGVTDQCAPPATRSCFHAELDEVVETLTGIARRVAEMMADASTAFAEGHVQVAEWVLSGDEELKALCEEVNLRCLRLLVLQAPVAGDLRVVLTAMRVVGDLERMVDLALHVAKIARLKHPRRLIPDDVRAVFAQLSMRAVSLAQDAAAAIERRDRSCGERFAHRDDEVDALRQQLFPILFSSQWSYGVELAVDIALIGRYYERFADHAVAIARQVSQLPGHRRLPRAVMLRHASS